MQENDKSGNYIKIIERFLIVGVLLFIFFDSGVIEAFRSGFRRGLEKEEIMTCSKCKDWVRNFLEKHKNFQQFCKKIVEHKHGTVTVKEVYFSDIRIITTDGGNEVVFYRKTETWGNVEKIVVEIRTKWDGVDHKNGVTVLEWVIRFDSNGKPISNPEDITIVKTDAILK